MSESAIATPPTGRMVVRACGLRCPMCGTPGTLKHWLRLREACRHCGLRFDRGEHDHFIGSYMLNLVLSETLAAAFLVLIVWAMWPDVDWAILEYGGVALMVAAPLALYPVSKLLWLALDLVFRAPTARDFGTAGSAEDLEVP